MYAQNILGDEHPLFGLARNSWLSGTASWAYQAATQHILGLRPTLRGLMIDPCIPSAWDGFRAVRAPGGPSADGGTKPVPRVPGRCIGFRGWSRRGRGAASRVRGGETHDIEVTLGR